MCKSKKMAEDVIQPAKTSTSQISSRRSSKDYQSRNSSTNNVTASSSYSYKDSWKSSVSSRNSLSSLRDSLPENPHVYTFSEISSATNNFLNNRCSSAAWRCTVRGNDVVVFQRKFRRPIDTTELQDRLLLICKSHHTSVIKLRGASISGNYIYLVYDYIQGASLADCLRNPKNPNFTVLSNWISRIQIVADLAHGLDYIHHSTGLGKSFIHNHIKSTSIIITESSLNAKICHFGTAELCGKTEREVDEKLKGNSNSKREFKKSNSGGLKFEGTRGYMSPEFQSTGVATQKSDVYAFGVVLLEILSGEEPLKYRFDSGGYLRVSVIETAREAVDGGGDGGDLRWWVDRKLKDSYPVKVAEKLARLGLECVEEDPEKRPDMSWVAVRVSKLYLESQTWAEMMGSLPTDFTVSMAPR